MADTATIPATTTAPAPLELRKASPRMLSESKFLLSSYATNRWSVTLEHSIPYERIFEPDFWSHVARKMKIGDIVELHSEDTSIYAELYVVAAHRLAANVVEMRRVDLAGSAQVAADASPLTVKFRGPHSRYCLMRGEQVIAERFQTAEEAEIAKAQHSKAFAA